MIISDHARESMDYYDITENEVLACLRHGKLIIKQVVKGEIRYGKDLELKDKKIIVIYTLRKGVERVITTYPIKRKKW